MDLFQAVATERRRVADLLETLSPQQWGAASCCGNWTVQETAGHLLVGPLKGIRGSLPNMIRARGNLDRANDLGAQQLAAMGPEQLVQTLRDNATSRFAPPGYGAEAPLTDIVMHGQDIARPLGLTVEVPVDHVLISLQTATQKRYSLFNVMKKLHGLRFEAADSSFVWGDGPTVTGTSLDLAHAMWGRTLACDALSGDGVEQLRRQLQG